MLITMDTANEYVVDLAPGETIFTFANEIQKLVRPLAVKHLLTDVITEAVMEYDANALADKGLISRPSLHPALRDATPWYRATQMAYYRNKVYNVMFTCLQPAGESHKFYLIVDSHHDRMNLEIAMMMSRLPGVYLYPLARAYEEQFNFPYAPVNYSFAESQQEYADRRKTWEGMGVESFLTETDAPGVRFLAHGLNWVRNTLSATRFMGEYDTSSILEKISSGTTLRATTLLPALYLHRNRGELAEEVEAASQNVQEFLEKTRARFEKAMVEEPETYAKMRQEVLSVIAERVTWEDLTAADENQILREMS